MPRLARLPAVIVPAAVLLAATVLIATRAAPADVVPATVVTDVSGGADGANAVALARDGGVLVAGSAGGVDPGGRANFALARYSANGELDPAFGTGGKVTAVLGAGFEKLGVSYCSAIGGSLPRAGRQEASQASRSRVKDAEDRSRLLPTRPDPA